MEQFIEATIKIFPFLSIIFLMMMILYGAHKSSDSKFVIFDLVSDKDTGKGSLEKIFMMLGSLAITLWFIDITIAGRATWEDAVAYGGLLGLAKIANTLISAKYNNNKVEE